MPGGSPRKGVVHARTRELQARVGAHMAAEYESGRTVREIAAAHGIDEMTASKMLRRQGVVLRRAGKVEESIERFWSKVEVGPDCWEWVGYKLRGYGQFWRHGRTQRAHRVAWEMSHGHPVPDDLTIDHLCRNPGCVRPDHMEIVPAGVNTRRGDTASTRNRLKTACHRGHALDGANLYLTPDGRRQCRQCARDRAAQRKVV